jgi:predicted dehydrogenase
MKKVRYAIVGAGWISQEAFMPAVEQTGNSEMTAIVTGNVEKARKLAEFYGIPHVYPYERYDEMLTAGVVDAVYVALPNSLHADYTIRAARAGVHAMVEKPLAVTVAECEAMIAAAAEARVFLMTAYRLHNEPGTVDVLEMIARGDIGEPRLFQSTFSFQADAANHRLRAEHWGGPLQDIGVYCLNAARHVFRAEPVAAIAMEDSPPDDRRFAEVGASMAATLRFPRGGIATFIASFGAATAESFKVVGDTGEIDVDFAYRFETARRVRIIRDGQVTAKDYPHVENFSGQIAYFSDCILGGTRPEADGEEGLADVRAMRAIEEAARTGQAQKIASPPRTVFPSRAMVRNFPQVGRRLLV